MSDLIKEKNRKYLVREINYGVQLLFKFDNGYGASVVKSLYSYGGSDDLWEFAVIKWDKDGFKLCYTTPITDDVIGNLTDEDVNEYLERIENL